MGLGVWSFHHVGMSVRMDLVWIALLMQVYTTKGVHTPQKIFLWSIYFTNYFRISFSNFVCYLLPEL